MGNHIRVNHDAFLTTRGAYQSISSDMQRLSTTQRNLLDGLRSNWDGDGSQSYSAAVSTIARQALMGRLMIQSLESQTSGAHRVLKEADQEMAWTISPIGR
ncbi:MAG: WXG100 family type VII secretion target [Coriobacteriia bacterium]|nr:WXG100 family type VII secretion target [Coriobacteriia bacterium]